MATLISSRCWSLQALISASSPRYRMHSTVLAATAALIHTHTHHTHQGGNTALIWAASAKSGQWDMIHALAEGGCDIDAINDVTIHLTCTVR